MTKIFNFFIAVLFSVYSSAQTNSESLKESLKSRIKQGLCRVPAGRLTQNMVEA